MEEIARTKGTVTAVLASMPDGSAAPAPKEVAAGTTTLWTVSQAAGNSETAPLVDSHVNHLLTCDSWAYPVLGQPILRIQPGVYVLPATGNVRSYVLCLRAGDGLGEAAELAAFEAALEDLAAVRQATVMEQAATTSAAATVTPSTALATVPPAGALSTPGSRPSSRPSSAGSTASATQRTVLGYTLPSAAVVSSVVGTGIMAAGQVTRSALVAGADIAGKGVHRAATAIAARIGRAEQPLQVSDTTLQRVDAARVATRSAAVITGSMVVGAAAMARQLGAAAAAALSESETGRKVAAHSTTPTGQAVKSVASAGVVAFAEVWAGLDEAAAIFMRHAGAATRSYMETRYGESGRPISERVVGISYDVGQVAMNARNLSVGGMVRRSVGHAVAGAVEPSGAEAGASAGASDAAAGAALVVVPAGSSAAAAPAAGTSTTAAAGGAGATPRPPLLSMAAEGAASAAAFAVSTAASLLSRRTLGTVISSGGVAAGSEAPAPAHAAGAQNAASGSVQVVQVPATGTPALL